MHPFWVVLQYFLIHPLFWHGSFSKHPRTPFSDELQQLKPFGDSFCKILSASAKKYSCIVQWVCICFDLCTWASSHQNSSSTITLDMMLFPTSFPHSTDNFWKVLSQGIIFYKSYEGVLVAGYWSPRATCPDVYPDVTRRWDIYKTFLTTSQMKQAHYWMKIYYSGLALNNFWNFLALSKSVACPLDFLSGRS